MKCSHDDLDTDDCGEPDLDTDDCGEPEDGASHALRAVALRFFGNGRTRRVHGLMLPWRWALEQVLVQLSRVDAEDAAEDAWAALLGGEEE